MNGEIKFYLSLFWRRIHYFLIFLALGTAVGFTLAAVLPPVYRAQAILLVESQQIPSNLAESTVQTGATEQLQIIQQRILTRANILEMANRLNVYRGPGSAAAAPMPADDIVADMRRRIEIDTSGGGGGRGGPAQATIVRVAFEASTGQMSAAVTNEVVTRILQQNVEIRTNVAGQTLEFFEEEVTRLEQELSTLGARILSFQEGNLNALPDSLDFRRAQQSAAQERLVQLEREEATLIDRRDRLVTLYETTGRVSPISASNLTPEERQLKGLQDELTGVLAILSPQNPRVKVLQARIAALETTVAAQSGAAQVDSESGQQLSAFEVQLADIDGQLDFLAARREEINRTLENLQTSIEATPGNAITLNTLDRNYANIRAQYDRAVANRARAETGDTIEALAKGQRISVIEQAIAPRDPESPNRPLIAAAGVAGGLALGLGFLVLLELLNSSLRRPIDLTRGLGIAPLGTIPLLRSRGEILRRRIVIVAMFAVVLVLVPATLWLMHTQVMPLDVALNRLFTRIGLGV